VSPLPIRDVVSSAYADRVSVRPRLAGELAVDRIDLPKAGILPGATGVATVAVTAWRPAARVVSLTGPTGAADTRRLPETTDASIRPAIKAGDRLDSLPEMTGEAK
jgi:hypothetical protein